MNGASSTGTEYVYDANGSLVQDYNKKIAKIQYNLLNLPSMLQFQNGNTTSYQYSNDGVKRKVTHQTAIANVVIPMGSIQPLSTGQIAYTSTTDYCGNVIYEDGILSKILTSEGYITLSGTTPTYHYYLKDHLGNNRVVIDQNGSVEQVNHYYPFGGLFGEGTSNTNQAYKYNGKELDRMHGLDWYDYGARNYDAALPVWTTVDPLAEKYYNSSTYAYCANNPIIYIDPDGRDWVNSKKDGYIWMDNVTSPKSTPKGYRYVGSENSSILSDLNVNYSLPEQSSNRIGYVAADAEEGKYAVSHMTNVKAESNVEITANVRYDIKNGTENNQLGRKFEGVNVSGTLITSNTAVDGEANVGAMMKVNYGGQTYTSTFAEPNQTYVKQTGTGVGVANINIPASMLSSVTSFIDVRVSGSWWVTNSTGLKTPVVYHSLAPIPLSFNHNWVFPNK